jgi:hypothetical protein
MAIPSVRALTAAVWAILDGHPQLPVFQSIADPATDPDSGKLLRGYAVLHPGGGDTQQSETNLAQIPDRLLWTFQVDAVGDDHDQIGWAIDAVRGLLDGKTLTAAGTKVGKLQPPFGYQPPPPRPQFQAEPARLSVPLQYHVLTVSTA